MNINGKSILVTGGTGSFGREVTQVLLEQYKPRKIVIFSRDEYKQYLLKNELGRKYGKRLRFFLGDVRDKERLMRAFDGIDIVIHAAALKQVPALEYNPIEAIKTNINGAINVIDVAIERQVEKVIALSTDKAVHPISLYGGTKLVSDKMFISASAYAGNKNISFSVVRYGNVAGSRGSVVPFFKHLIEQKAKFFPITDFRMTRFWLSLERAVSLVIEAIKNGQGGEVYVAKCPSFKIIDLAKAMDSKMEIREVGIRPGEKLHEVMLTDDDAARTYEYKNYFITYYALDWWSKKKIIPKGGKKIKNSFNYSSGTNSVWLETAEINKQLKNVKIDNHNKL